MVSTHKWLQNTAPVQAFDQKFENVNQLEAFLLYFPETKKFLCPADQSSRYPNFPYNYGSNYGLLIKTQDIGGTELVVKEMKKIDIPTDYGKDSLDITYDFTESLSQPKTRIVSTLYGHDAENFQFAFSFLDDKQKKDMLESYIKNYCGETELEYQHENGGKENLGQKPFVVSTEFTSNKLLEKNGENTDQISSGADTASAAQQRHSKTSTVASVDSNSSSTTTTTSQLSSSGGSKMVLPISFSTWANEWPILAQAFTITFVAEWGDRSQIATIAMAAAQNALGITIGACIGHALVTGLAVVGGRMVSSRISERAVAIAGGSLFLIFSLHSLYVGPN